MNFYDIYAIAPFVVFVHENLHFFCSVICKLIKIIVKLIVMKKPQTLKCHFWYSKPYHKWYLKFVIEPVEIFKCCLTITDMKCLNYLIQNIPQFIISHIISHLCQPFFSYRWVEKEV